MANEKIVYEISVTGNASKEFENANKTYNDFKKNIETPTKELPLTRQLRDIKLEMQKLDQSGQGVGTKAFDELSKKAGSIKDSINAANDAIKTNAVGSEFEKQMNVALGAFKAVNGGAQVVTGTMSAFGIENENVTKSIQTMMGLMSMANGVQMVHSALTKEGALVTALLSAKNTIAATTQSLFTASMWASVTATKALKVALISTGIGAAVVAIGYLISAYMESADAAELATNKEKERQSVLEGLKDVIDLKNQAKSDEIALEEKNLELMKAQGKSKKEIYDQELKIINMKQSGMRAEIASYAGLKVDEKTKAHLDSLNAAGKRLNIDKQILLAEYNKVERKDSKGITNKETQKLINAAPKTFNVYINELGTIRKVNIMSDEDEVKFQKKMVGVLTSALQTIQVQNA